MKKRKLVNLRNQDGAILLWFIFSLPIFLAMIAMAFDVARLAVVKNELQNAADAGALAAARFLYNNDGTSVNEGANQIGFDAATANKSENDYVEVNWTSGNTGDVQRGHWSFGMEGNAKGFTPSASLTPVNIVNVSKEDLDGMDGTDGNPPFINAVRVTARLKDGFQFYFARIFLGGLNMSESAVAYIGFAGSLLPGDADLPIAICVQSITGCDCGETGEGCETNCNMGYMLSDGQNKNTAAWTNFSQPCATASTDTMRPLLKNCLDSNPDPIELGNSVGATNGVVDNLIYSPTKDNLVNCWKTAWYDSDGDEIKDAAIDTDKDGWPDQPWNVTLLLADCPVFQVSNCMETCGAVSVNILWILEDENKVNDDAPYKMGDWSNNDPDGKKRWDSFVTEFDLRKPDGTLALYSDDPKISGFKKKSIYFRPDCTLHEPAGKTGGENYGILAEIPVLVE